VIVVLAGALILPRLPAAPDVTKQVIYADEFAAPAGSWTRLTGPAGSSEYDGAGLFRLEPKHMQTVVAVPGSMPSIDRPAVTVEGDVRLHSTEEDGEFGLLCRVVARKGEVSFYAFLLRGDGYVAIAKQLDGTLEVVQGWTALGAANAPAAVNHLAGTCSNIQPNIIELKLTLNGVPVYPPYRDTDYNGTGNLLLYGSPGLYAHSAGVKTLHALFDNFVVSTTGGY